MKTRLQELAALTFFGGLLIYTLACVLSPISWSPDGRWIALTRYLGEEKQEGKGEVSGTELWIVSPEPIERKKLLTVSGAVLSGPAWSKDSKSLYVLEPREEGASKTTTLWKVGLDGAKHKIATLEAQDEFEGAHWGMPAPSPDERRIAFTRDDSTVVVVRNDGKVERTFEVSEPGPLWWSPDGRWLTIQTEMDGDRGEVGFVNVDSNQTMKIDGKYIWVAWLPGGDRLAALKVEGEGSSVTRQIALLDVKANMREVAAHKLDFEPGGSLVVSPKGDALYTASGADGEEMKGIVRVDLRTGKTTPLYRSSGMVNPWAVSPDGRSVAFREQPPAKQNDLGYDSIVGVLNPEEPDKPLYLAVDDKQWATVLEGALAVLEEVSPDESDPDKIALVRLTVARVEKFLEAFRRDFPDSPSLKPCEAKLKEIKEALQTAAIGVGPGGGAPRW